MHEDIILRGLVVIKGNWIDSSDLKDSFSFDLRKVISSD